MNNAIYILFPFNRGYKRSVRLCVSVPLSLSK